MKLNTKRTVLIGLAFASILCFWQFYDQVIPYIFKYTFGRDEEATGIFMSLDNVLGVLLLPLFGSLSDRTHSRLGKRTPYILYGTIGAVALFCALAYFQNVVNFWGFIITLMVLLVVMSVYRSPAVSYMPDVTEKPLRSKGNAIINLVGYIGGIFAMVVIMLLLKKEKTASGEEVFVKGQSFVPAFLIIAAFMLVTVLVMVFTVNENKVLKETNIKDDEEPNADRGKKIPKPVFKSLVFILISVFLWFMAYNAVTSAFSRYCEEVWKVDLSKSSGYLLVATVAAIVSFVPLGIISSKIGRKKAVLMGIAVMTVFYAIAIFIKQETPLMYIVFAFVGIGWASINVNSFPMAVEMCSGADVGKYTGYYYTFSMAAQVITPILSGVLIKRTSLGYEILFPYAVLFSALSFVTMCFVRHGDSKPDSKTAIAEQFAGDN